MDASPNSGTIANFAQRQIMVSFAYLAYCGEDITTPNPESQIASLIDAAIPQIPPIDSGWSVAWGPATYTTPGSKYQDNMMFVAQNGSQLVVAIRGTNFVSDLDWLMEDFDVLQMMNWPPGADTPAPADAMMSEGTSIGLAVLLGMRDPQSSQSLLDFLQAQASSAVDVCVTGHSLGGCLAGTLALYLIEQQNSWDGSEASTVSCVTFAGPTAGNAAFAAYSDSTFAAGEAPPGWDTSLGTNCDAVRCDLDVAPQFCIASNISDGTSDSPLFDTYGSDIDFAYPGLSLTWAAVWSEMLKYAFPPVAAALAPQGYTQIVSGAASLTGTFNGTPPPTDSTLLTYLSAFKDQVGYQHSSSYPTILQVPQLLDASIIVRS